MDGVGITPIIRQALGRTARLGDLYDARTDTFVSTSIFTRLLPTDSPAITILENHHSSIDYSESDSFKKKFSNLGIDLQLKLSILAGFLTPGGSAEYPTERKESSKSVERAHRYDITTVTEQLNLECQQIEGMIKTPRMLDSTDATHVVVRIDWGAKCFVSVTDHNHENDEKTKIGEKISAKLEKLKSVGGTACAEFEKEEKDNWNKLSVKIFGDVVLDGSDLCPTTVDDAVKLIRKLPKLVQKSYGGKGKPVTFHMLPLPQNGAARFNKVDDGAALKVSRLFSRIDELNQRAYDFISENREAVQRCDEIVTEITYMEQELRVAIKQCVIDIRSGNSQSEPLTVICDEWKIKVDEAYESLDKMSRQKNSIRHKMSSVCLLM